MTVITETNRLNDLLKWEMENQFSREILTILSGQALLGNEVVAKIKTSCPATGTADAGNTGDGTCTGVTAGKQVIEGTYTLTCIAAATDAGTFEVKNPNDVTLGQAVVGTAYTSKELNFTLNDGTADFVVGDVFTITVTAGSGKAVELDYTAVTGAEDPIGFVIADYDASEGDKEGVAITKNAIIVESALIWPIVFTSGGIAEIKVGDTITGASSGSSAVVRKITLSSGTWAGGDAAGTMLVDHLTGDFEAENITLPGGTDDATVAATATVAALATLKTLGIVVREEA